MPHFALDSIPSRWTEYFSLDRVLTGIVHDSDDYYHTHVSLLFNNGIGLKAFADEYPLAPLFDCSILTFHKVDNMLERGSPLSPSFALARVWALVRDEWIISASEEIAGTVGRNPHKLCAGLPGSAPLMAKVSATTLAGIMLEATDARRLAVYVATDIPLNIELEAEPDGIRDLLAWHECRSV